MLFSSLGSSDGAPGTAGEVQTTRQRCRVLIIDDNPDDRASMRQMLLLGSERQYVFAEAERGDVAVQMLRNSRGEHEGPCPFDCLLLDFHLPDMNALEVLTAVSGSSSLPPCPTVVITGWDGISRAEGARLLRAGAQDYIGKSWTTADSLTRSLENSIERFELLTKQRMAETALADADVRKNEFLAMLSHELRNPLAPLLSAVQILRFQQIAEPQHTQAVQIIERQVRQLTRLVEDLLDVSRFTTGKFQLRLDACTIQQIVERAVATTQSLVLQRTNSLIVSLPERDLPIHADAARLEQVIVNLLHNAVKYTDAGGSIWLTVEEHDDMAVVRVRDTGIGIPPELLPRVFDLFSQAEQSLHRSEGGLGVGLCLVQRLVEQHHGSIEVFSTVGHGSEFVVRLPLMADGVGQRPRQTTPTLAAVHAAHRVRILIVDDNVDAAESLGMVLQAAGHDVRLAHDGESALTAALANPPQVVLLDIGLPRLDGYEVAKRLRQQAGLSNVVIVAVTGYGQASDRERSRSAGFDHHLLKPVDLKAVQSILDVVVH
ncbi:MAG: response regulator [Gemmatimonadaceae bacterium]|nr:response regulator [Gemmatimonadaceae bacterium]